MFGIESGSQKMLDRLKKEQTLEEVETAVTERQKGRHRDRPRLFRRRQSGRDRRRYPRRPLTSPPNFRWTPSASTASVSTAARRSGRNTSKRGFVNDDADWYKYFKCSEIDPTCLGGPAINAERTAGLRRLFLYKLLHYPVQTFRLLRRFLRYMPFRDVVHLIIKPFLGNKQGPTRNEVLSRAVEHQP